MVEKRFQITSSEFGEGQGQEDETWWWNEEGQALFQIQRLAKKNEMKKADRSAERGG